ncbi:hypothetical protein ACEWY4_025428 [Coilia grayii]|uniref:TMEM248/TMEM219 domain-containing protein n=1 Tax=Coilia grayii TaxID=363190 RepID=A0ABD1IXQ0_9TELE
MGKWQPISNLRSYLEYHPPAVIFYLCVVMLSVTFIGFGFYTQTHSVKNPDVTPDWNQFLESIASLRFCLPVNGSGEGEPASVLKERSNGQPGDSVGIVQQSLLVPFVFRGHTEATPSIFSATLFGNQVGVKGEAGKQMFNMSLSSYPDTQTTNSKQSPSGAPLTCLQLRAPESMLPKTPSPADCSGRHDMSSDRVIVRALTMEKDNKNVPPSLHCLSLEFTPDDQLTPFLSQEEKTLVGQHLLLVSATLLVICGLLCFSASLPCSRSRRYHGNDLGLQKEPLLES